MLRSSMVMLTLACSLAPSLASAAERNFRFCTVDELDGQDSPDSQQIWGAGRVHREVVAAAQRVRPSIFSAYIASYIVMTEKRDVARCNGKLRITDRNSELIGDRLADIMSRTHILLVQKCFEDPNFDPNFIGFCQDLRDVTRRNLDGLSAAMLATATYLSSHMASSLVALIYDDMFWSQFPDPATHNLISGGRAVLGARLQWVKRYKPYYDENNAFLSRNFTTVAHSLAQACYMSSKIFENATRLAQIVPGTPLIFGKVRDRTFATALQVASSLMADPTSHPLLVMQNSRYELDFDNYHPWDKEPAELVSAKRAAREVFFPPLSTVAFRSLGGLKQQEYESRLAADPSCVLAP